MIPKRLYTYAGWLLRVALIVLFVRDLAPIKPRVHLDLPQTVVTEHPAVCVHTRLTDEVEEWKIQRTLQMVREMGAATIVEYFPWPYAERNRGTYNWTHADRIMRHAANQGLTVIARLDRSPAWARPPIQEKVTTLTYLEEEYFDEFAAFVGAFVNRYSTLYGDQLRGVIIWNEPNLSLEWGGRAPDPEAYTELLRQAYAAAHAANPDITVFGAALAPTTEAEDSSAGMNEIDYLTRMYAAGAAGTFDVLAVHTYGFTQPATTDPDPDVINFRRIELLREVMIAHGDGDTPMTITESGWNDDPRWTNAVRPVQRITYTLAAFQMVEAWPWVDHLCLWIFRQPADHRNRRDMYYSLVSSDFYAKPIYEVIQAYAHDWENPYLP
ncbi:MAG: beta-galactosidase [Anaerolineae bacterium]|nr:beta-galactosidase [Anaerolineae bacterium]